MKKISLIRIAIILAFVLSLLAIQVSAAVDPALQKKASGALVKLELLRGDAKGNLKLDDRITRCEYFTLILRMMGYENTTNTENVEMKFTDISKKHWAYNNMKAALKHKLVTGYDNKLRPDDYVTLAEAEMVLVRALGYESTLTGKWPDNVTNKSAELGLDKNLDLPSDRKITRGEASVLIYNSLTVKFKR